MRYFMCIVLVTLLQSQTFAAVTYKIHPDETRARTSELADTKQYVDVYHDGNLVVKSLESQDSSSIQETITSFLSGYSLDHPEISTSEILNVVEEN